MMAHVPRHAEKKRIEAWVLTAARTAGVPIPEGEVPGEEPDFRISDATLGIEVTEILRPASSNFGILPVEEESFHREVLAAAERVYYGLPNVPPAHVRLYFANAKGRKRSKREMARTLAEFVKANVRRANPFAAFTDLETPDGFAHIAITASSGEWWGGSAGGYTTSDIRAQLGSRIAAKNKLVPTYRANLPTDAQIWLLLHSGVTVARSMSIPYGIEGWKFPFNFDRVFWFAALEREFVEIQRCP
jgi:hypothetical protein